MPSLWHDFFHLFSPFILRFLPYFSVCCISRLFTELAAVYQKNPMLTTETTIDGVIAQLDRIIDAECRGKSCMAYFPILYRKVTVRVKEGIAGNEFENNPRMEALDVRFANRYLDAYTRLGDHQPITESWKKAFDAAEAGKFLIMQHLLLGMNAHINLDLGISVAENVGDDGILSDSESDFNKINAILASMISDMEARIIAVSPLFGLLKKYGKGKQDKLVSFSIDIAREGAWLFANQYHGSPDKDDCLTKRDAVIALLADKLTTCKSWVLKGLVRVIYFFETKDVSQVVAVLKKE